MVRGLVSPSPSAGSGSPTRAIRFIFMRVQLTRGPVVESVHQIDVVVADSAGPALVWGDADRLVIPRSAAKFFQAVPLLATGAAERFAVTDAEVMLACSSHSAEPGHVEAVRTWLERLELTEEHLECGPDTPINDRAAEDIFRRGDGPAPILNCCSGKHTGFLAVARHLDLDPSGYIEPDHPVQRLVTEAVAHYVGHDLSTQEPGRDGCGIPTFAIPLAKLARGMVELISANETDRAAARIVAASADNHFWISGTGRCEMTLGAAASEPLVIKGGAEGVYMAALPERGLGIALKVRDGAGRAAEAAIASVLSGLGVVTEDEARRPLYNKAGTEIGVMVAEPTAPTLDRLR